MQTDMTKVLFIVNPVSGGIDKTPFLKTVPEVLGDGFELEIRETGYAGHASLLARDSDADIVVAVGGDGTVNEIASELAGSGRTMGIIPFGSGNGLAYHLGLGTDRRKALECIRDMSVETIDCAEMDSHKFFCTCGVGLDAAVGVQFAELAGRGLHNYVKSTVKVWKDFKPEHYTLVIDGESMELDAELITVANANQWGNRAYIAPMASLTDGLLDVAVISPVNLLQVPPLAGLLMTRHLDRSRKVHYFRGKSVDIHRSGPGPAHYDGEPLALGADIEVRMIPRALRVIVPRHG